MEIEQIIKKCIKNRELVWKDHILEQMRNRNIRTSEIFFAFQNFKIIEAYYEDKPFPSFLVLGYTKVRRPLHIVIAVNHKGF